MDMCSLVAAKRRVDSMKLDIPIREESHAHGVKELIYLEWTIHSQCILHLE